MKKATKERMGKMVGNSKKRNVERKFSLTLTVFFRRRFKKNWPCFFYRISSNWARGFKANSIHIIVQYSQRYSKRKRSSYGRNHLIVFNSASVYTMGDRKSDVFRKLAFFSVDILRKYLLKKRWLLHFVTQKE